MPLCLIRCPSLICVIQTYNKTRCICTTWKQKIIIKGHPVFKRLKCRLYNNAMSSRMTTNQSLKHQISHMLTLWIITMAILIILPVWLSKSLWHIINVLEAVFHRIPFRLSIARTSGMWNRVHKTARELGNTRYHASNRIQTTSTIVHPMTHISFPTTVLFYLSPFKARS